MTPVVIIRRLRNLLAVLLLIVAAGQGSAWAQTFTVTSTTNGTTTTFTITRSGSYLPAQTVNFRTVSLSAYAGQHFLARVGTKTFTAGQTSDTVKVTERLVSNVSERFRYQGGTTRTYRLEVLDINGFWLAEKDRDILYGTNYQYCGDKVSKEITDLVYINGANYASGMSSSKYLDVAYSLPNDSLEHSGDLNGFALIDDGYDYKRKSATVSTGTLISSTHATSSYLNTLGYKIYATVCFIEKEKDDGYQYIQIVAGDKNHSFDGADPEKTVNNPSNSIYKACFELSVSSNTSGRQFFPHRYNYANQTAEVAANMTNSEFFHSTGRLWQQKFKSGYHASTSGSVVLDPDVSNITVRFDAGGDFDDTWGYNGLFVRMALCDASNPTLYNSTSGITVSAGPHIIGNTFYISVPFSEIVHVSGGYKQLYTTWGTVGYVAGDSTNVITYKGTINASVGTTLAITEINNSLFNDLAGNYYQGSNDSFNKTFSGVTCTASYTLDNYNTVFTGLDGDYWVSDNNHLPNPHPTTNFYKGTKTNEHRTTLTETTHYTLSWTDYTSAGTATVTATGTGSYTGSASTTYPVRWAAYAIRFYKNHDDATGTMAPQPYTYSVSQPLAANAFSRTGYNFAGWSTSSDGAVVYTDGQSVINLTATDADTIDLYALWTPIDYSVHFNKNHDDATGTMLNQPFTYDVSQALTANAFSRTGYNFAGWSTSSDGAVVYTDGQSAINLIATDGAIFELYAVWTPIDYSVRFNKNHDDATGTMLNQPYTYSVSQPLTANAFSRNGYDFAGWSTTSNGAVVYTDGQSVINLTATDGATVDLYAQWTPHAYNLSYDLAGGSVATANPATYTIETPAFTLVNPTRTGYTFAGWTGGVNSELSTPTSDLTIDLGTTGDRSYTATWTPVTYSLTYDLTGGSVATANPATYTIETPDFTLVNPTRTGYAFAGWTGTGLAEATTTVTVDLGTTGDRSYTATWIDVWNIAGGADGSQAHPYLITDTVGLNLLAHSVNGTHGYSGNGFNGIFFKLGADITYSHEGLGATESNYTSIGGYIGGTIYIFSGTFDGDGHTVSGIRIYKGGADEDANGFLGLFGCLFGGTVKNVTLTDAVITGCLSVGGIAGSTEYDYINDINCTIENCHVTPSVTIHAVQNSYFHGGIAGSVSGAIRGCTSAATVSMADGLTVCSEFGGIVGLGEETTLENCLVLGATVSGTTMVGAIVGGSELNTFSHNYYWGCTVGGTVGASGVGIGGDYSPNNNTPHDITTDVGAVEAYIVAPGTDITLSPAGSATTTYPYGGIEVYDNAPYYGGTLYAVESASLTLGYTGSETHIGFKASSGTLTGISNPYSLTLAGADVVVNNITCAADTIGPAFTIRPFNDTTLCVDPDGDYEATVNRIAALVSPADLSDNYSAANAITVTSSINFNPQEDRNDGYETDTDPREVTYGKRTYSQVWTATDACGNITREKLYIHLYPLATIRIDTQSRGTQTIIYGEDITDVLIHHQYSNLALSPQKSGGLNLNNNDTTGTLRGMPDSAGTFVYTLTATCWHDCNIVDTTVTITVNPRPITIIAGSATKKYDGMPLTSTNYGCVLTSPFTDIYNRILVNNDSIAGLTITGSQTNVGSSENIPSNAAITIATDTTAVKNPSYAITYLPGTLTVIENDTLITVIAGSGSKQYDGTPLTMTAHDDFTVIGVPDGLTWTATADGTVTNVTPGEGEKAVNAVTDFHIFDANNVDVTSYFTNIHRVSGTLAITPKPITITAASDTKEYDGTALTNSTYSYTNSDLVAGETLASVTVTGSQTFAGSSDNVPSAAVIMNDNVNVNDNYNITFVNGTLTVTQKPLTITAGSDTTVYNGAWLYNNTYTHTALADGDALCSVTVTGRALYGESKNVPSDAVIKNANEENVTASYDITYVNGRLKRKQKKLFITSGSASKVYDGTPLVCHTYTYSGLVACDTILTVRWESFLKNADTIDNQFSLTEIRNTIINDTDVTNCYIIEPDYGKLMVARKPLTITGGSASKPYDGTPLTCDSFTHTELVAGDSIWSVSLVGSQTEVGSCDNVPSDAEIQDRTPDHVTDNYDITYVPGTLTVTPGIFALDGGWQALAAPVHDEGKSYWTIDDALTTGTYDFFRYDEPTTTWENQKSGGDAAGFDRMDLGRGYLYRRSGTLAIPFGSNANSGDVQVTLTAGGSGEGRGFNLVGNPYPYSVTLCLPFYSLNADGTWTAHAAGDDVAVGQGVLVYTDRQVTLTFHDDQGCVDAPVKGYLPPLPKGLCFNDNDNENEDFQLSIVNFQFAHWDGDRLIVTGEGTLRLFDVMGRELFRRELNSELRIPNSELPAAGVYVLKLNNNTQKIVIK